MDPRTAHSIGTADLQTRNIESLRQDRDVWEQHESSEITITLHDRHFAQCHLTTHLLSISQLNIVLIDHTNTYMVLSACLFSYLYEARYGSVETLVKFLVNSLAE